MSAPIDGYAIYEVVNPDDGTATYQPRLDRIAAGGFKVVINYALLYGTMQHALDYINYAATKGLKVAIALDHPQLWNYHNIATRYASIYASAGSPAYYTDDFTGNTSANFATGHQDGGSDPASVTWDTANTRLAISGGSDGDTHYTGFSMTDGYIEVAMLQADANPSLEVRRTDNNNLYFFAFGDASSSSSANSYKIWKIVGSAYTQLASGSIAWTRGALHRMRFQAVGTTISAYMDGNLLTSVTDSSLASGNVGVSGGNATTNYFYSMAISQYPDFETYVINQVKALSGTWGYYIGDEATLGQQYIFGLHADNVKLADGALPRLIIEDSENTASNFWGQSGPYWQFCEVGGDDNYPYGRDEFVNNGGQIVPGDVYQGIQSYCTSKSIQSTVVLQAFSWTPPSTNYPTAQALAIWRKAVTTPMSPRLVIYYSYQDIWGATDFGGVTIVGSSNPTQTWNNLVSSLSLNPDNIGAFDQIILGDGPLRYYPLSEASPDTTIGIPANELASREVGAFYGSASFGKPSLIPSVNSSAVQFDGSTSFLSLPRTTMPAGAHAFSVECALQVASLPNGSTYWFMFSMGIINAGQLFSLYLNNSKLWAGVQAMLDISTLANLSANTPYWVSATYDGTTLKLYLNGTLQSSGAVTPNLVYTQNPILGARVDFSNFYPGEAQSVCFYNYALTQSQVSAHFNAFQQSLAPVQYVQVVATMRDGLVRTKVRS